MKQKQNRKRPVHAGAPCSSGQPRGMRRRSRTGKLLAPRSTRQRRGLGFLLRSMARDDVLAIATAEEAREVGIAEDIDA